MSKNNVVCQARPLTAPAAAGTLHPSRPMQMAPVFEHMAALLRKSSRTATLTCYVTLTGDKPEWSNEPVTYTRKVLLDSLDRLQGAAQPHMSLLTKAGLEAIQGSLKATKGKSAYLRMADLLESTRECKAWKDRDGNERAAEPARPAFGEALLTIPGKVARAERTTKANNDMTDILAVGEAWYCDGITDADGQLKPFANELKARKAWARKAIGSNWAADLPTGKGSGRAAARTALLAPAPVFKQGEAFRAVPEAADFGDIDAMHHSEVRRLARENGAGDDVTTGKGAAAKSREYLRGLTQQKRIDHGESVTRKQVGTTVEELSPEMVNALIALVAQAQQA